MAEVPHGALCQTSRGEQAKKFQGFWEPFHRFGQVAVGTRVFRDPFPDFWKYMLEIQCINLLDGKPFWHREFQDESQSIGFQHTMDFGKALLQVLEIPHPEGHRDGIETVVLERQGSRVAQTQFDLAFKTFLPDFLHPNLQHFFGNVHSDNMGLWITFRKGNGQVRRACGEVEDGFGIVEGHDFRGLSSPHLIYIKG